MKKECSVERYFGNFDLLHPACLRCDILNLGNDFLLVWVIGRSFHVLIRM